jgi:hypothetical protein
MAAGWGWGFCLDLMNNWCFSCTITVLNCRREGTLRPGRCQLTAAPLGSRTVQVICPRLLQPTGRFRRRSLSSFGGIEHSHKIMNAQQITKTKSCRSGTAINVGIGIGAAIGAAMGAATDNMAAGVAWGVALGAAVGAILTFTKTKSD